LWEGDFEQTVEQALAALRPDLRELMSNVAVVIEEEPARRPAAVGLLRGLPLTMRGSAYAGVPPDKVHDLPASAQAPLGADPARLRREIRRVVLHEVAHHFGISDERRIEIGRS
jgi:predicted Zn-dependent protease with MMP-like domain